MSVEVTDTTPVLVGVGVAGESAEAVELMGRALEAAAADAGPGPVAARLLAAVQRVAVPQGSWRYSDPGRLVARRIGAPGARSVYVELGVPQQTLVNQALADIAAGHLEVAAVVGGEARAFARQAGEGAETEQQDAAPDERQGPTSPIMSPEEIAAGLTAPVAQYAMIDNALRAAEHQSIADHRVEVAELWHRFNEVAGRNPLAAFKAPRSAQWLATASDENRPLAWPYNKWHASQWTVDQAAALLLCSVGAARRLGVPTERWVFPLVGLESSQAVTLSHREHPFRWPAMGALGRAATRHLGTELDAIETIETYSCFPAAVRVQQRELGLPVGGTPTVTGGMAFAGGPLNNFVYQATAAVIDRVRNRPGSLGMVTTVSGILTKPGLAVWSTEPRRALLLGDLAEQAATSTDTVEVVEHHDGPATVVTYTVIHDRPERARPARLVALVETPGARRCLASSEAPDLIEEATHKELVGQRVAVRGTALLA